MKFAIVYTSQTGNTRLLAETIRTVLPPDFISYFGSPSREALSADRIYAGFWTDRGSCDQEAAEFLKTLKNKELFLFGTAGFGGSAGYYDKILQKVKVLLDPSVTVLGSFMCQGKMPLSVRKRYEQMLETNTPVPHLQEMIQNFDRAVSHPDPEDLRHVKEAVQKR